MRAILCPLLGAYLIVLLARALMSWFPIRPGTGIATVYRILLDLTEPVLAPLRRVIPPAGAFDLSFLVAFLALGVIQRAVCAG